MSSPKGFATQKKILNKVDGFTQEQSEGKADYATLKKIGSDSVALEVVGKFAYDLTSAVDLAEAGSTKRILKATAHGGRKGDFVRFLSGANDRMEYSILSVPDANTIILDGEIDTIITLGDSFKIYRYLTQLVSSDGAQAVSIVPQTHVPLDKSLLDFSSTNVDNTAYVEINASVGASAINKVQIFMSSGEPLLLAFGAAASEVDKLYIIPGGNGILDIDIPAGTRLSVKAVNVVTVSSGILMINYLG